MSQLQMMKAGLDNLTYISEEAITLVKNHMHADATNLGSEVTWEPGALEFEAEMRILDNKVAITMTPIFYDYELAVKFIL